MKPFFRSILFAAFLIGTFSPLQAQPPYDLLFKGGHVLDPGNGIDRVADLAISRGKIARVASDIPPQQAAKVIDASGFYITPGLIDLHVHVFVGARESTLFPDDTALLTGVTTVVDAGTSGWRTFDTFKELIIDRAKTRVLAFLNIVGGGMKDGARGENDEADMDPAATAETIEQHPDIIVGVKNAHYSKPGFTALRRAIEAGRLSGTPVMVDDDNFTNQDRPTREKLLDVMRPGDLHTHTYNDGQIELVNRFTGKVQPYMREARRRGVLFDLGHGGGSFLWPVATKAMDQGFAPDTISGDLHPNSIMLPQVDMPNLISKLMALGMPLEDAIRRSTVNTAQAIQRYPELGTLGPNRVADVAVFRVEKGVFALKDARRKKLLARRRLRCVMTVRAGEIVFDDEGLGFPRWQTAGEYETIP